MRGSVPAPSILGSRTVVNSSGWSAARGAGANVRSAATAARSRRDRELGMSAPTHRRTESCDAPAKFVVWLSRAELAADRAADDVAHLGRVVRQAEEAEVAVGDQPVGSHALAQPVD